ncbi:protease inhibitor I42 family protein [Halanaerobium sp. ST460_2HS_T2]|uniref:protease inhibitor I42 family protein n=1 Tax=Halanaerobium sp. ST460_2HS_T2 TaxID=2183914 RepID=UPI000DF2B8B4|nr:protease inhibitor I42 family protein [Halanaerobium sp. ST460_2HS_T2]RCW58645.1 chagasin family peptidase inhibitor I42 [Halanaerobium sp. ST460_2HS_T2]
MNNLFKNSNSKIILLFIILICLNGTAAAINLKALNTEEISQIKLFENPAAGQRWQIKVKNPELISLLSEGYEPLKKREQLAGEGGIHSWYFEAAKKGAALVNFNLLNAEAGSLVSQKTYLFAINLLTREIAVDEILELKLAENPSTGYRWSLIESEAKILELLAADYQRDAAGPESDVEAAESKIEGSGLLVGRGGIKSWTFRGAAAGYQRLSFELARKGGEVIKTVDYLVLVE